MKAYVSLKLQIVLADEQDVITASEADKMAFDLSWDDNAWGGIQ